jgi:hypothetical protein
MKLRVKSVEEIIAAAAHKLLMRGDGGKETSLYLPPRFLPPVDRLYRWERHESTNYGEVRIYARPAEDGGFIIRVKFKNPVSLNPVIDAKRGEELLKKLQQ